MTNEPKAAAAVQRMDPVATLAANLGFDRTSLVDTMAKTIMPSSIKKEDAVAFCAVAQALGLNPLAKEIYAFPGKGGGIQAVVSVDGWITMARKANPLARWVFVDHFGEDGKLSAITAKIHLPGDPMPLAEVTEYMAECRRSTDPWKQWPARMLRHKALIQALRYAFGFSGAMEPDEYSRMVEREAEATPVDRPRTLDALSKALDAPKDPIKMATTVKMHPEAVQEIRAHQAAEAAIRDQLQATHGEAEKRERAALDAKMADADNPFAGWTDTHGEGEGDPEAKQ